MVGEWCLSLKTCPENTVSQRTAAGNPLHKGTGLILLHREHMWDIGPGTGNCTGQGRQEGLIWYCFVCNLLCLSYSMCHLFGLGLVFAKPGKAFLEETKWYNPKTFITLFVSRLYLHKTIVWAVCMLQRQNRNLQQETDVGQEDCRTYCY